jgi:NADH-quinone oxidoreductase subunit N
VSSALNPVLIPAIGALVVLALDLVARPREPSDFGPRSTALAGIRLGSVAVFSLATVALLLRGSGDRLHEGLLPVDAFGVFGIGYVLVAGMLILSLSLTHFGMARSRPAEPLALLLFAWSGSMAAIVTDSLLIMMIALELAWLPMIALVAIDSRRLSSSESSLKVFFAHAFASLIFAHGVGFIFGATGRLDLGGLTGAGNESSLFFQVGLTLFLVGLLARGAVAPFHPWFPDVHEGAPSFVTTHIATIAQATTFFVTLRVLHSVGASHTQAMNPFIDRIPILLGALGVLGLLWGHAMALVQLGLRRLVGWLGVGQVGFFVLALVDANGEGAQALILALVASGISIAGVMATLSSLSHHERACEHIGDLAGMMHRSPIRAGLLALFLLSLGGMPGTIGFVARFRILSSLEHGGYRWLMVAGLVATVLALTAIGRPLLAMLRPEEPGKGGSRALTNEQFVLTFCGVVVVYFGIMPIVGETNLAGQLALWIDRAVASLRLGV